MIALLAALLALAVDISPRGEIRTPAAALERIRGLRASMLMIGTNNNGINGYNPTNTASGVKACLDLIAAKQPQAKVLLCGYLPRAVGTKDGAVAKDNGANVRNRVTTELIRRFADGKRIVFVDMYDRFLEGGVIPKSLMGDYIHPTEKGYAIWLSAIERYLGVAFR